MTSPDRQGLRCEVIGGEKLPPESGGKDALCAAIEQALAERALGTSATVEVRVLSKSRLQANATTADGRKVSDQNFAIMDSSLTRSAFERFAKAIASELARAGSH